MLSQPNNVTRAKRFLISQPFSILSDHGILTRAENGGRNGAVAKEVAVSRKNISGKEKDISLWPFLVTALLTNNNIWAGKEVDDKVLSEEINDKLPNNHQEFTISHLLSNVFHPVQCRCLLVLCSGMLKEFLLVYKEALWLPDLPCQIFIFFYFGIIVLVLPASLITFNFQIYLV